MGELRNVIETKRKILTMIKGAKNEKRHQSHLWNLWKKLLDWGKLHNQRLQKLIRIRRKKKKQHPCLTKTLKKSPGLNLWVSFCVWLKLISEFMDDSWRFIEMCGRFPWTDCPLQLRPTLPRRVKVRMNLLKPWRPCVSEFDQRLCWVLFVFEDAAVLSVIYL